MKKLNVKFNLIITSFLCVIVLQGCVKKPGTVIYVDHNADRIEVLAALEIRKYIYQRTGNLLPISEWAENNPTNRNAILVGNLCKLIELPSYILPELESDDFVLKTISSLEEKKLLIYGGSSIGTLYAAYYYLEQLGIGFYLEGDIIPDKQIPFVFPELDIKQTGLFSIRGILPFHDFPEGPDWWGIDEYKAIITQLPKLRMNFIGLHTYPEGPVGPEPMVWIGPSWNILSDGQVKYSYPSSHFTTCDSDPHGFGYEP